MAVTAFEDARSRSFGVGAAEGTGTRIFHARATGESDIITAIVTAVAALAPYYWNNMVRLNINPEHQGTDLYTATVEYATPSGGGDSNGGAGGGISSGNMPDPTQTPGGPGTGPGGSDPSIAPTGPAAGGAPGSGEDTPVESNFSMEIGGRPPKLYCSLETYESQTLAGTPAGSYGRLINVQPDGTIEGVDIPEPTCVMSQDFNANSVTWKFVKRLMSIMWHTNNAAWYTFKANEVALIGATIKPNNSGQFTVNYRWGLDPEREIPVDGIANGLPASAAVTKPGWAYVWVSKELYNSGSLNLERPNSFYIEKILPDTDFEELGIGR